MDANMKRTESKKSDSCWWDSRVGSINSKWLEENLQEMDHNVKRMLKLIEEDGNALSQDGKSLSENAEMNRSELTAHVEEFNCLYKSLAEHYDHLLGEFCKRIPSEVEMQVSVNSEIGSDQGSPGVTPHQKLGLHKPGHQAESLSSGGASSGFSLKEGTESSSLSSDSESESYISSVNNYLDPSVNTDGNQLPSMKERQQVAKEDNADSMLKVTANESYEELLGRVIHCEEELRVSNLRLQLSEQEVALLKSGFEKSKSDIVLAAQQEIKKRETELQFEKRQVFELKKHIAELETHASDSNFRIGNLMEELEVSRERLKISDEEIATLKAKLDSEIRQVLELQEWTVNYKADLSDRDHEVNELKVALSDAQENFCVAKAQMQSDIISLSEKQTLLDASLNEWKLRGRLLEDKVRQCEVAEMEMKSLHDIKEFGMLSEINQLAVELAERGEHVEVLNKDFDKLKLKYDMLMAEKDGFSAKVNTLIADVSSRDNQIRQMEEHLHQLHMEHVEMIAGSDRERKVLKLRVEELEKEVDRQRIMILDGAEGKREAIRQLCFSLEHYRSGYKELREAFLGHKRHAVIAA